MSSAKLTVAFASAFSLFLMGACSGNKTKDSAPEDTIVMDSIEEEVVIEEEDSLKTYYSEDLKSFAIKGDVEGRSEIRHGAEIIYPIPTMELNFDKEGKFTGSLKGLYAKKNEDGIFYNYSMNYEDGTSWELTYTEMNDESYPIKAQILESGPQGTAKVDLSYSAYEYDAQKNWVFRSVTMNREFTDTDTGEKTLSSGRWKEVVSYTYKETETPDDTDSVSSDKNDKAAKKDKKEKKEKKDTKKS
ncbi:MAG: hypothetical protein K2N05_00705 [Muribaculaceae bacterium]|nr:hypothetical protein [Muribaculaceae bacterium]